MTEVDGSIFEGQWRKGMLHGYGIVKQSNKDV